MRVKIERINNWLQLLGNAGIIISIIVLAYQVNEANRVSSAQAFQSRAQMGAEITWTLADSEYIGPIMHKVYECFPKMATPGGRFGKTFVRGGMSDICQTSNSFISLI